MWWIALKLLAPFGKGVLGALIRLALVVGIVVVGSHVLFDVNLIVWGVELAGQLIGALIDAIADAVANKVMP